MEHPQLRGLVAGIKSSDRITAEDVLRLRRSIYGGPAVTKLQIEGLLDLDSACADKCPEWATMFGEAVTVFIVDQEEPRGYVDEANADWLIDHVTRDGHIDTGAGLEAVIDVVEKATRSPDRLVRFALEAVRDTVLNGSGPARHGGRYKPGVVTEADVDLLRRVLYAPGGDQHIAITRSEAEVLFDINDATAEVENHPSWSDLFVKAVANSVLFCSGYTVPAREEALRRERWLDEPADPGAFMLRMAQSLARVFGAYRLDEAPSDPAEAAAAAGRAAPASEVTEDEARWLLARLYRDGRLHANERALLLFLREHSDHIHPVLKPALEQV
jgi:hypothetical protein